jgi:hypothetical protein
MGHPCLRGQASPCTHARLAPALVKGRRRQPQPRRRRHVVRRRTGHDRDLAAPTILFPGRAFPIPCEPLGSREPRSGAGRLAVDPPRRRRCLPSRRLRWGIPSNT